MNVLRLFIPMLLAAALPQLSSRADEVRTRPAAVDVEQEEVSAEPEAAQSKPPAASQRASRAKSTLPRPTSNAAGSRTSARAQRAVYERTADYYGTRGKSVAQARPAQYEELPPPSRAATAPTTEGMTTETFSEGDAGMVEDGYAPWQDTPYGGPGSGNSAMSFFGEGPVDGGWGAPCGPCRGPIYVRGEYLLWWINGDNLPPLATTSPSDTPQNEAGVLAQPDTTVLFGDQAVNNGSRSGARITAGWWFHPNARLEGEVFGLGGPCARFDRTSEGDPILARPFFNLFTQEAASQLFAYPDTFAGNIAIRETSNFGGAGIHVLKSLVYDQSPLGFQRRIDLLYGFRYLGLYENLTINSSVSTIDSESPSASLATFDGFKTSNSFYGANLGAAMELRAGRWSLLTIGRFGLGGTASRVVISGNSTATAPDGSTSTSEGGLLAMPTNIGTYKHGNFTVLPQLEMKLACALGPRLRVSVGYDILYWSRVVRPGSQVDLRVNPTQSSGQTLLGSPGPLFTFRETPMWAQGFSTGVELRF